MHLVQTFQDNCFLIYVNKQNCFVDFSKTQKGFV